MKPILIVALTLLLSGLAGAQSNIPGTISYQGFVSDAAGVPIGNAGPVNREVILRVYGSGTGADLRHSEKQTVTISAGQFSVLLGTGLAVPGDTPATANLAAALEGGSERFIGVTVDDGTPNPDGEISPRQQIVSTAFALQAKSAEVASSVSQTSGQSSLNTVVANTLTMNGPTNILGGNLLVFGSGGALGSVGADLDALTFVGRGPSGAERKLRFLAQGGATFDGPLGFGQRYGQHLNLYGSTHGIGVQTDSLYFRGNNFSWYTGGAHADQGPFNAGGGTLVATLNTNGLQVHGTIIGNSLSGPLTGNVTGNVTGQLNGTLGTVSGTLNGTLNGTVNGTVIGSVSNPGPGVFAGSHDHQHAIGSQSFITYLRSSRDFAWYVGGAHANNDLSGNPLPGGGTHIATLGQSGFLLNFGGIRVPGTTNQGFFNTSNIGRYGVTQALFNQGGATENYSFWGNGVVVGAQFLAFSDARIKKVQGRSDTKRDLQTLMGLEITDYTKVDDRDKTPKVHKKVIAQQVEKVFPQAVSKTVGTVPDIFRYFTAKSGFIAVEEPLANPVKVGDQVKIFPAKPVDGKGEVITEVTAVTGEGFQVKEKLDGEIFIYGREVDDYRTVDYEAIAMLNVSATQELHRKVEALEKEKAALEKELAERKAQDKAQDTRLAALEAALKGGVPTSSPAKGPVGKASTVSASIRR